MTDELISKTDVVKIVKSVLSPASSLTNVARARRQMLDQIYELESKPEPHWIPVTERLPEEDTDVLVTVHFLGLKRTHRNGWNEHIKESYYVEVASYINGEWSSASDEYKIAKDRHKVVAWMPLPEPMSEQYKNKQSNCNKMPLPEPYKGVTE